MSDLPVMIRTYKPLPGAGFNKDEAQEIGAELEAIAVNGELTPPAVVEFARDPATRLHGQFEWNDAVAAERWREDQARHVLNHIAIQIVPVGGGPPQEIRAFHSLTIPAEAQEERRQVYVHIDVVQASDTMRAQVLQRAKRELDSWVARYSQYEDVFGSVIAAARAVAA